MALSVLLAGCGGASTTATTAPVPTSNEAAGAAATAPLDREAFQARAREVAAASGGAVLGWGTGELDDHPGPDDVAVVQIGADQLAYVIETGDGRWWRIDVEVDGKSAPWRPTGAVDGAASPPVEPTWADGGDVTAIDHQQAHHPGYERVRIAIAGGANVALHHEVLDDAREDDTPRVRAFAATAAACAGACPPLTSLGAWFVRAVTGPVDAADVVAPR